MVDGRFRDWPNPHWAMRHWCAPRAPGPSTSCDWRTRPRVPRPRECHMPAAYRPAGGAAPGPARGPVRPPAPAWARRAPVPARPAWTAAARTRRAGAARVPHARARPCRHAGGGCVSPATGSAAAAAGAEPRAVPAGYRCWRRDSPSRTGSRSADCAPSRSRRPLRQRSAPGPARAAARRSAATAGRRPRWRWRPRRCRPGCGPWVRWHAASVRTAGPGGCRARLRRCRSARPWHRRGPTSPVAGRRAGRRRGWRPRQRGAAPAAARGRIGGLQQLPGPVRARLILIGAGKDAGHRDGAGRDRRGDRDRRGRGRMGELCRHDRQDESRQQGQPRPDERSQAEQPQETELVPHARADGIPQERISCGRTIAHSRSPRARLPDPFPVARRHDHRVAVR